MPLFCKYVMTICYSDGGGSSSSRDSRVPPSHHANMKNKLIGKQVRYRYGADTKAAKHHYDRIENGGNGKINEINSSH